MLMDEVVNQRAPDLEEADEVRGTGYAVSKYNPEGAADSVS